MKTLWATQKFRWHFVLEWSEDGLWERDGHRIPFGVILWPSNPGLGLIIGKLCIALMKEME